MDGGENWNKERNQPFKFATYGSRESKDKLEKKCKLHLLCCRQMVPSYISCSGGNESL